MALSDILNQSSTHFGTKEGISEERLEPLIDDLRNIISFWRAYPDMFIDFVKGPDSNFEFYIYQRIFLRAVCRHRYFYGCAPRGFSKTFLTMMGQMISCILYPGADMFVTSSGKEQSASLTMQKVEEISKIIPPLEKELVLERGGSKKNKDNVSYLFKNGSKLGNLAARETSRGQRRTGGIIEEVITIDPVMLQEVIIPTTISAERLLPNGKKGKNDIVSHSERYITSAGYRDSFAYTKLREMLIESVVDPDNAMIIGCTYKTPLKEGLLDENFLQNLKMQETYSDESFSREIESRWSGSCEGAFFPSELIDDRRKAKISDEKYKGNGTNVMKYIIGVDVGRLKCTTEAVIIRATRSSQGADIKTVTNIFTFDAEHFEDQAIHLKRLYYKYNAEKMVIDANGIGTGLIDFMIKPSTDINTGEYFPPFGVYNDDDGVYKKFKTHDTEENAMYLMKANASLNTQMYSYCKTQLFSGKLTFLIDEAQAKSNLLKTKIGQAMKTQEVAAYLRPYVLTTILKDQMVNLIEKNEGQNIILERINTKTKKDKFSALIYALFWCQQDEEIRGRRSKRNMKDFILFGKNR